jgi:cell wall-associated NlpC family hydrolase
MEIDVPRARRYERRPSPSKATSRRLTSRMEALVWRSALLVALPTALFAQANLSITPYAAQDQSLSTRPLMLGLTLSTSMGPIALRGSGSVARSDWMDSAKVVGSDPIQAFAYDVDLVLNPGRNAGAAGTFGALEPRLFAGYGVRGEATSGGGRATHNVVSVGTILSYSLLSRMRLDIEARRMVPSDAVSGLFDGSRGAWEYRGGFSLHFGKGNLRRTTGILSRIPGIGSSAGGGSAENSSRVVVAPAAAGTLLATADKQVGTPYVWGAVEPQRGFDCSGFVQYVFNSHGVRLPRTSREMKLVGSDVGRSLNTLKPGDLMFFAEKGGGITHVAIYAGDNMMIHSSRSGNGVGYDDLTTPRGRWYQNIYVGAQRVLGVPIQGVTMAGGPRQQPSAMGRQGNVASAVSGRNPGKGIGAFLAAAGMVELSDVAKRLYKPDEMPDAPDNAPKRRW